MIKFALQVVLALMGIVALTSLDVIYTAGHHNGSQLEIVAMLDPE